MEGKSDMKAMRKILGYLLILFILGFILGVVTWMYYSFYLSPEKEAVEQYVIDKQSEKGLFLAPRYRVITDDSPYGNDVTRKTFDSLEFGDKISGYKTNEYGFFTTLDQLYEGSILLAIFIVLGTGFLAILSQLLTMIPAVERIEAKLKRQRFYMILKNGFVYSFLAIGFLVMFSYVALYTNNLFHKLVPIGQTEVEGQVIGRDYEFHRSRRGGYSTYDLMITFTAQDGNSYQVKKRVTRSTYDKYEYYASVPLNYRNRNPNDIFIKTESMMELIGTVISWPTLLYGICLIILYFLLRPKVKALRRKRKRVRS